MTEKELLNVIGVGLGTNIDQLLTLATDNIKDGYVSLHVGPLQIQRSFLLPAEALDALQGRSGRLFQISREEAVAMCGTTDFLPLTMKRYYQETGDAYYPMHILGMDSEETTLKIMGC